MKIEQVRKLSPLDRFCYWIRERELVRLGKYRGNQKPWTDDTILQNYRFCNVRRMDDKVSQWLYRNWYTPNTGHPNMLLAATLARHFNKPEALEAIGFPHKWEPSRIKKILRKMKASGQTIFNGAYMVRGIETADKTEMVIDRVCKPLVKKPPAIDTGSMRRSVEALLPYWGFSTFMAGQVVADLRWAMEGSWDDRHIWAPMGPGSKRGLNRVLGRPTDTPVSAEQFEDELYMVIMLARHKLPASIIDSLEAMDIQNCLCEVDKYNRCLFGEGKPKQRYNGVSDDDAN